MQYTTNQLQKGLKVEIDGIPYRIIHTEPFSPGKGQAFTRLKLKNMLNQSVVERRITSGHKLNRAQTEEREMQYLYRDSTDYYFIDNTSYEQINLKEDQLEKEKGFLQSNIQVRITYFNGKPIGIELPNFVVLKISQTEPSVRGDTVSGSYKTAELETGINISVPFHIKIGDLIKVDTRNCTYVEKVNPETS